MTAAAPIVKGWCPGALRPMLSGDGWVVRVKPRGGRLSGAQVVGIGDLALRFGNGWLDLSSRANLQIRGVAEADHPALVAGLRALGLIDRSDAVERRRNVIVTPFHRAGDGVAEVAAALEMRLTGPDAPDPPAKFGFAIGEGLADAAADIRLERLSDGWLVRADGASQGATVSGASAADAAIALAHWFMASGGAPDGRGRMAAHLASGAALPKAFRAAPVIQRDAAVPAPVPGPVAAGYLAAFAFGQVRAESFRKLGPVRLTPWRMVLIEGARDVPEIPGLIADPADPLLRVVACTGAPGCPQALGNTRDAARRLARIVPGGRTLHVSGCAKGCAHPGPADMVTVATDGGWRLGVNTTARAATGPAATINDLRATLELRIGNT